MLRVSVHHCVIIYTGHWEFVARTDECPAVLRLHLGGQKETAKPTQEMPMLHVL